MYQGPLYITSDHAGYQLKKRLIRFIENELNQTVIDLGPNTYDDQDDFTDYIFPAAEQTAQTSGRLIACCGSGQGEVIAGNKVIGMRLALGYNIETAELAVLHNNANGLALAARVLTEDHAMAIVKKYLETTKFLGGKYQRRNDAISSYEQKTS
jgi:ribose 5-phosphate isomerase B